VFLGELAKLVCATQIMSIENEQLVPIACIMSSHLRLEVMLGPIRAKFLICPSLWRDRDTVVRVIDEDWFSKESCT
jgi:hypothetical protein